MVNDRQTCILIDVAVKLNGGNKMKKPVVSVEHVRKVYGKKGERQHEALRDVNMKVYEGEFVGIMGPSGSGKTTLLNILSALDSPTSGDVRIAGDSLKGLSDTQLSEFRSKKIGFIFQDFNLLENLTMEQNISLPLSLQGVPQRHIKSRVHRIARILGIQGILKNYPPEVSGGQKQRVAAARALVHEPNLLLGDEPTGSLDSKNAKNLLEALKELNEDFDTTILMVTHDAISASYCKRILFIQDGTIYREIERTGSQADFYQEILSVLATLELPEESQV